MPKTIRDMRRWPAGTRLTVEETLDGVLLKASPAFAPTTVDAVFGAMSRHHAPLSIEDMDAAVSAEAARRARD